MIKKNRLNNYIIYFFLFLQFLIWNFTKNIKPTFEITPLPPTKLEQSFFSLGDSSLLYRIYGFKIQNAGDTFGETVPLRDYDFEKLEKWFYQTVDLDSKSEYIPSIAGMYYSQSQNPLDNKYIVDFLVSFADKNPEKYWRWYVHAAFLAKTKLKNQPLAIEIGSKVISLKNKEIPQWARVMSIFIAENYEDQCFIFKLLKKLNYEDLKELENDKIYSENRNQNNFLLNIIIKRIEEIKNDKSRILKCKNYL